MRYLFDSLFTGYVIEKEFKQRAANSFYSDIDKYLLIDKRIPPVEGESDIEIRRVDVDPVLFKSGD